jgi:hypothetical protein
MPFPDSNTRARAEQVDLIEAQLNTLKEKTFGCVTRRNRICQLYAELIDREAAA